jgi:hypothetical protein
VRWWNLDTGEGLALIDMGDLGTPLALLPLHLGKV